MSIKTRPSLEYSFHWMNNVFVGPCVSMVSICHSIIKLFAPLGLIWIQSRTTSAPKYAFCPCSLTWDQSKLAPEARNCFCPQVKQKNLGYSCLSLIPHSFQPLTVTSDRSWSCPDFQRLIYQHLKGKGGGGITWFSGYRL